MGGQFHDGRVALHAGDMREVLPALPENSVDSCVTDPPYHFASIVKRFGADDAAPAISNGETGVYRRSSSGFMGKRWDGGQVAHEPETWAAVLRVLKPGAHVVAFHAPKNWHHQTLALERAGFEIRDHLCWLFGSGFPKSHNLDGDWDGWGTALKPAFEPIVLARKPLSEKSIAANVLRWGTGAINVDACRVDSEGFRRSSTGGMARKANPVFGQFARTQVLEVETTEGRWPANIIHDGSAEVVEAFPDAPGQSAAVTGREPSSSTRNTFALYNERAAAVPRGDAGSAARFFYSAKADATDRIGSRHPTVKPLGLMQWLCRLVTPPGGLILDPFAGTGTTAEAALREGFRAVLIEREAEYLADIERRMGLVFAGHDERSHATVKARGVVADAGPLFGDIAEGGAAAGSSTANSHGTDNRANRTETVTS